jgi:HEAT repeat protein
VKSETGRSRVYLPLFSGVAALIALIAIWLWVVGTQQTPLSPAETNTSSQITARQASIEIGLDSEPGLRELSSTVISVLSQGEFPSNASRNEPSALIATLLDSSQPLKLRRQAAWQLAKVGTSEALAALRQSLSNAPPQLRATIAEALGNCPDRQASAILKELLKDENEDVIRGAIRGLAANGNHAVVDIMSQLILSPKQTDGIRGEAALALGEIQGGDSLGTLVRLVSKVNERELTEALLSGLGRLPIEQTQEFFQRYLESSETEIDLRVAALEALGESAGAAAPFLIKYLQSEEAEIRAAAAWAIANLEAPGDVAGMLVSRLRSESEPEVRIRLYQALQNQERFDVGVTSVIATEQDLAARLAGYQLLAREVARGRDSALAVQFDQLVVPRLAELAISGASMNERLNAVVALKQANTPAAIRALAGISAKSGEAKIVQAATMN